MKYIKLFENHQFYNKISFEDWVSRNRTDDNSSPRNHISLKDVCKSLDNMTINNWGIIDTINYHLNINNGEKYAGTISLLDDEWHMVNLNKNAFGEIEYYECDQWRGLIELLKNKRIIEN